ncbi:MAG: hypothetical protein OXE52_07295, partial [Chloroflexi bacterium]|nr:hypothetical protein [Chloroflexota bacterium]
SDSGRIGRASDESSTLPSTLDLPQDFTGASRQSYAGPRSKTPTHDQQILSQYALFSTANSACAALFLRYDDE